MADCSGIFKEIADKIIQNEEKKPNYATEKCEDQYIGILQVGKFFPKFTKWIECSLVNPRDERIRANLDKKIKKKRMPTIAIVIESPHKEEFSLNTPMPAVSATGENLFSFLPKYIIEAYLSIKMREKVCKGLKKKIIPAGKYRVCLINAIQYECSLSVPTKTYRDEVFTQMWKNNAVQNDFKERLKGIENLKIVINACTKGESQSVKLRVMVQEVIDEILPNIKKFHSTHPCSWKETIKIEPDGWVK